MTELSRKVQDHYNKVGLLDSIADILKSKGLALENLQRSDLRGLDEMHVRGAEVSEEIADTIDLRNKKVLDLGSGLGGSSRMMAELYNCNVTGIDVSEELVKLAIQLSALLGLEGKCKYIKADACDIPLDNESFEIVWTQHVQMNIERKWDFYTEVHRVLKDEGLFVYYDIFKTSDKDPEYPMPWSKTGETSFLFRKEELHQMLEEFGFIKLNSNNQTDAGIEFFRNIKESKIDGAGFLLEKKQGMSFKFENLLNHLKSGILELESAVWQKCT